MLKKDLLHSRDLANRIMNSQSEFIHEMFKFIIELKEENTKALNTLLDERQVYYLRGSLFATTKVLSRMESVLSTLLCDVFEDSKFKNPLDKMLEGKE